MTPSPLALLGAGCASSTPCCSRSCERAVAALSPAELARFEQILELPDPELLRLPYGAQCPRRPRHRPPHRTHPRESSTCGLSRRRFSRLWWLALHALVAAALLVLAAPWLLKGLALLAVLVHAIALRRRAPAARVVYRRDGRCRGARSSASTGPRARAANALHDALGAVRLCAAPAARLTYCCSRIRSTRKVGARFRRSCAVRGRRERRRRK